MRRPRWWKGVAQRRPALLLLLVAPLLGEGLSGSSPPRTLVLPWHLAFMVALYGCGALVCREVAARHRLGFRGVVLLGVAYGVFEEGLVDRYWSDPSYWHDAGVGRYAVVGHTNVLLAAHLTLFHAVVSVCCSVLVVERAAPALQGRPWLRRRWTAVAAVVLATTPLLYGELDRRPPAVDLVAAAALVAVAVLLAFAGGRATRHPTTPPDDATSPDDATAGGEGSARGRRGLGLVAFVAALLHWVVVYSVARTGLPWPVGVLLALLPVAAAGVVVRRLARTGPYGADGLRVVSGVVVFFVLLDVVLAVNGAYDMLVTAALAALLVRWLRRPRTEVPPVPQVPTGGGPTT